MGIREIRTYMPAKEDPKKIKRQQIEEATAIFLKNGNKITKLKKSVNGFPDDEYELKPTVNETFSVFSRNWR